MNPTTPTPYATSLEEVLWGGLLVAITMALHGFGMLLVLRVSAEFKERFERSPRLTLGLLQLVVASWTILIVHLVEVFTWAGFFLWKNAVNTGTGAAANASLSYYFALLDYTTLGCEYDLYPRWRLLSGMIAMAGLLTFAWSTGVLLTLAQDFQDQQVLLYKQRRKKHQS
ncbi:MAG: hypothetical protein U0V70_10505 [Terriglobia bacterium]